MVPIINAPGTNHHILCLAQIWCQSFALETKNGKIISDRAELFAADASRSHANHEWNLWAKGGVPPSSSSLKWLTTYDFSPDVSHGWQNLVSGDGATFDTMLQAYKEYGMKAMPMLPHDGIFALHVLNTSWEANTEAFVAGLAPYIKSGVVAGIFMGDELCEHGVSLFNLTVVADKLRALLGPRNESTGTPFIYTNENAKGIRSWKMVPASLDYISMDRYDAKNTNGSYEIFAVKEFYTGKLYPKLHPHQGVFIVPGIFANDPVHCQQNNVSCPLEGQAEQVVIKLDGFFDWAMQDDKIAGFNPWHFNNRSVPQWGGAYNQQLGGVSMPTVVGKLKEIGEYISKNNNNSS
jgi:hypothetical protein